ncbi:MAG: thiamine-phosphate kinase [Thermoproteota archaeon]|nr:thiamine-phosphate kinase [Thermoproteota archaeon]
MTKLDEKEIINIFANKLGVSDLNDVAQLNNGVVLKSDMLVASTDVPCRMKPWQIARKSIIACVSDLSAKGIRPYAVTISLGIPNSCKRPYVKGLAEGFAIAANEFRIKIVGGDTNEACDLVIDCCMIGFAKGKVPTRRGAAPGDIVIVSGRFGFPPAGLAILLRDAVTASRLFRDQAVQSVLEPNPRQRFGLELARYFSSSIDSSDGLATSLYELASQSGVDIMIDTVPTVEGLNSFSRENDFDLYELVFHGGEEYEIVATIPQQKLRQAGAAARRAGITLYVIGRVQRGSGNVFVMDKLLENRGYRHFS